MNSPKHLPAFVFIMGFSLLVYSMYVFFLGTSLTAEGPATPSSAVLETSRPEGVKPETPEVAKYDGGQPDAMKPESGKPDVTESGSVKVDATKPEAKDDAKTDANSDANSDVPVVAPVAEVKPAKPIPLPKAPRIIELDRTIETSDTFAHDLREAARKPADQYLQKSGVKMNVPDGHMFREASDGEVKILIGTNTDGKEDFYMFTFNKKSETAKMQKYLTTYFSEQAEYKMKGKAESHRNRLGLKDLMLFKGTNSDGEEFQAYSFVNSKANRSHILLLKEKDLSRQPAKIRLIVDSMQVGS